MLKNIGKYVAPAILAVMIGSTVTADDTGLRFQEAFLLLEANAYDQAGEIFSDLYQTYPDHASVDQFLFFKAKAAYYAGRHSAAANDFRRLTENYPDSRYLAYSHFFLGNSLFRIKQADKAIEAYISGYAVSDDRTLDNLIIRSLQAAVAAASPAGLAKFNDISFDPERKCKLVTEVGETLMKRGEYQLTSTMLEDCRTPQANNLKRRTDDYLRRKGDIGIILPMSGELKKYADQILDGIMLRLEEFTASTGREIRPVLMDTRGDDLEAGRIVKNLDAQGIAAAIGPLTSDESAVASAVLSCGKLPLIIPAASEGGLTLLSGSTYQLQANLDWQGIRMADFAVEYLNADTAAIITPTATENLRMAGAFKDRFEELGGTVLGVEYFRIRDTDFGPYVKDLKELIISDLLDSIVFVDAEGDTIEAEEVPVWLDCLYIPAGAGQLRQLLPQINFYNLNTVYLGGDGWGNETVYRLGEHITKNCYFSSGLIDEAATDRVQEFYSRFDRRHGREPGRLEKLGYDAASLLCLAMEEGHFSRSEINEYLANIKDYEGVSGNISFGPHRENLELPIYSIENGEPVRVYKEK